MLTQLSDYFNLITIWLFFCTTFIGLCSFICFYNIKHIFAKVIFIANKKMWKESLKCLYYNQCQVFNVYCMSIMTIHVNSLLNFQHFKYLRCASLHHLETLSLFLVSFKFCLISQNFDLSCGDYCRFFLLHSTTRDTIFTHIWGGGGDLPTKNRIGRLIRSHTQ